MRKNKERLGKGLDVKDSNKSSKRIQNPGIDQKRYLSELNFACVLIGETKHLEKIKEYILQEYVNKGLTKLIRPTYDESELHIVTDDEWKEYQKLKEKRDQGLIGYFM